MRPPLLSLEKCAVEPTRLRGREPWCLECVDNLVRDLRLIVGDHGDISAPFESSVDVLAEPGRVRDLVGETVELANLFEQRLELRVVKCHFDDDTPSAPRASTPRRGMFLTR